MKIVEKNKAIKQLQKLYKGITISAVKRDYNCSNVEVIITDAIINDYITNVSKINNGSLQCKRTNEDLTQTGIDLKNQIMEIINNGITYRETGDYGEQPSEYWNLEFTTKMNHNLIYFQKN